MMKSKLKFRCSQIGVLMTNARSKTEVLGDTAKNKLHEIFLENELGYKEELITNAIEKGLIVEEEGIDLAIDVNKWNFNTKNTKSFSNEFLTGTPDLIYKDFIVDIKSSFNAKTFPFFAPADKVPNKHYYDQLQGYLALTGLDHAVLTYVLVNTPEKIIGDELFKIARKLDVIEVPIEIEDELRRSHDFTNLKPELRVKNFEVERDEKRINEIYERVEVAREYYEDLKNQFNLK